MNCCYIIAGPNGAGKTTFAVKDEAGKTTINDAALYERLRKEFAP